MTKNGRPRNLYPADFLKKSFAVSLATISIAHADDSKLASEPLEKNATTSEQHATSNTDKSEEAKCGAGQCGIAKCGTGKCAGSSSD